MTKKINAVIVGGGFAGTKAALELAKSSNCSVTLVSDHADFRYYPGLYHTATGGKSAGSSMPLDKLLKGKGVEFVQATATKLDRKKKQIETAEGKTIAYDSLILALGNVTNYFGIEGLAEHAYGIKSIEEADRFKKHLHDQFIEKGCPDLNYVIVGGGPTGIELAGALPNYLRAIMKKHGLKDCPIQVKIVEALPQLLPRSPKDIAEAVAKRLQRLGVEVLLDTAVKGQTADALMVGDSPIKTETVVWTAGVSINPFFKANNFAMTERNKVVVDEYLQAEPDIYVLGDNAATEFSGLAQTALHDGIYIAKNIIRRSYGDEPEKYLPKEPIYVIPVGKNWASVQWGKLHFGGLVGWFLRLAADLVGFHDLEPWPKASKQLLVSMSHENFGDCPACNKKESAPAA